MPRQSYIRQFIKNYRNDDYLTLSKEEIKDWFVDIIKLTKGLEKTTKDKLYKRIEKDMAIEFKLQEETEVNDEPETEEETEEEE